MKRLFLFLLYSVSCLTLSAQGPNWLWAKRAYVTGTGLDRIYGSCNDTLGNLYITGSFSGSTITFGGATLVNTGLTTEDIFVVKLDPLGNEVWAKRFGGTNDDRGAAITCDKNNHLYITGFYSSYFIVGTDTLNSTYKDVFTFQLDLLGNVLWTRVARGNNEDYSSKIKTFSDGSILVAGSFASNKLGIGNDTIYNDTTYNYEDIFLLKYDNLGNLIWAKSAGGNKEDYCQSMDIDSNDNIYLSGYFRSLYPLFGSSTIYLSNGNLFLAKYDALGNCIWAKSEGGLGNIQYVNLAIDSNNNPVIFGDFNGNTLALDTLILINTNSGTSDMFLAKHDSSGNVLWAKSIPGNFEYDYSYGILTDPWGNIFIAGEFANTLFFENDTIAAIGFVDLFFAEFGSGGNEKWAKVIGSLGTDEVPACLSIDKNGTIYYTGGFISGSLNFGSAGVLTNSTGLLDPFIAKIKGPVFSNFSQTACDSILLNGTTYLTSGSYTQVLTTYAGTDSILSANLTINTINASVSVSGSTFSSASTFGTYQWLDCDASFAIIPSETNQNFVGLPGHDYAVTVSNLGCIDTSQCYHISLAGLQNETNESEFVIIPNPFISDIVIYTHLNQNDSEIILENTLGEKILQCKKDVNFKHIDLSFLPAGIYFISLIENNKRSVRKIIKASK